MITLKRLTALGCLAVVAVGLVGFSSVSTAADAMKGILIVNSADQPIPTLPQGLTTVTGAVTVGNPITIADPVSIAHVVSVRNVDEAAFQPFQVQSSDCSKPLIAVPNGKRAVIEWVSASNIDIHGFGDPFPFVTLFTQAGDTSAQHAIPVSEIQTNPEGFNRTVFVAATATKILADPGTEVFCTMNRDILITGISISGHFVTLNR
jgi:hypothetical protein